MSIPNPTILPLSDWEVAGFTDSPTGDVGPRRVHPLLRRVGADNTVADKWMIPLAFVEDAVVPARFVASDEVAYAQRASRWTVLDLPFPALPYHTLWVSEQGGVGYQSTDEVAQHFAREATRHLEHAKTALAQANPEAAVLEARRAFAFDTSSVEALGVLAAAHERAGRASLVAALQRLAEARPVQGAGARFKAARISAHADDSVIWINHMCERGASSRPSYMERGKVDRIKAFVPRGTASVELTTARTEVSFGETMWPQKSLRKLMVASPSPRGSWVHIQSAVKQARGTFASAEHTW